jgi:uncharacterized membrane protein
MSDPQVRRFPFWLTASVLINLVLVGLLAGVFLNGPPKPDPGRGGHGDRPVSELSREEREGVRQLMRASFESGREAMEARREAERHLADTLRADPYDATAARAALTSLREADRIARDTVADRMFDGLDELSPRQRAMVARIMAGNMDKRGRAGERFEKFRERREERREGEAPEAGEP